MAIGAWETDKVEVIITDDGDHHFETTGVTESFPAFRFISGPQRGPAANRNNGASLAKGEWLIFIDDDCLPDANLLKAYTAAIEEYPEAGAFEGCILPDDWNKLKKDMAECPVNTTGNCFWSANIVIRADLFRQIGGFDEQFLIAAQEDQDIYLRLKKLAKIVFVKDAIVVHPVRIAQITEKIKRMPAGFANWEKYYNKHFDGKLPFKLLRNWYDYQKHSFRCLVIGHPKKFVLMQTTSWFALRRGIGFLLSGSQTRNNVL